MKLNNIVNLNNIVVKNMEPPSDLIARMSEPEWLRMVYDIQTQKLIDAMIQKNTLEIKNNYYKNKIIGLQRENRRLGSDRDYHVKLLVAIQQRISGKTDMDMLYDSMYTFEPSYRHGSTRICA